MKLSQYLVTCLLIVGCSAGQDLSSNNAADQRGSHPAIDNGYENYKYVDFGVDQCALGQHHALKSTRFTFKTTKDAELSVASATYKLDGTIVGNVVEASPATVNDKGIHTVTIAPKDQPFGDRSTGEKWQWIRVYYSSEFELVSYGADKLNQVNWVACESNTAAENKMLTANGEIPGKLNTTAMNANAIDYNEYAHNMSIRWLVSATYDDLHCEGQLSQHEYGYVSFDATPAGTDLDVNNQTSPRIATDANVDSGSTQATYSDPGLQTENNATANKVGNTVTVEAASIQGNGLNEIEFRIDGFNKVAFSNLVGLDMTKGTYPNLGTITIAGYCVPVVTKY